MEALRTQPAIYLAHDHMDRPEDFARDLAGGITGEILHLAVDSWFDAPTRDEYESSDYGYDGFLERGLVAVARVLEHGDAPENRVRVIRGSSDLERAREQNELALILGTEGGKLIQEDLGLLRVFFTSRSGSGISSSTGRCATRSAPARLMRTSQIGPA